MLRLTKLDGSVVYLNDQNIQWIEAIPDTAVTFIGGARILVREKIEQVLELLGAPTAPQSEPKRGAQASRNSMGAQETSLHEDP